MKTLYYAVLDINHSNIIVCKDEKSYIFVGSENQSLDEVKLILGLKEMQLTLLENYHFNDIKQQLLDYYSGTLTAFNLPFKLSGTPLQQEVWKALLEIPHGEVCTYKELAIKIGRPTAIRAVASAVGKNPLLIVVPCHRVIGSDHKLRGYRGGLDMKKRLLNHEKIVNKKSLG